MYGWVYFLINSPLKTFHSATTNGFLPIFPTPMKGLLALYNRFNAPCSEKRVYFLSCLIISYINISAWQFVRTQRQPKGWASQTDI